jgi:D-xylulose reductase
MVLGHEGSGTIVEIGHEVKNLEVGDRVCMEPGIPDPDSKAMRLGIYNLDPAVRFWATPPIHGCLTSHVVHPAAYTFKLPKSVSFAEGAMVEPLAVGMHAAGMAAIKPGEVAVVSGAGTIGMVTALAALAGGVSRLIVADVVQEKLDIAAKFGPVTPVNVRKQNLAEVTRELTDGWGANIVFECSGNEEAIANSCQPLCPGGRIIQIGEPVGKVTLDIVAALAKQARIQTIFRYANVYPQALALLGERKIDLGPLITDTFDFADSIKGFDQACNMKPTSIKMQILVEGN